MWSGYTALLVTSCSLEVGLIAQGVVQRGTEQRQHSTVSHRKQHADVCTPRTQTRATNPSKCTVACIWRPRPLRLVYHPDVHKMSRGFPTGMSLIRFKRVSNFLRKRKQFKEAVLEAVFWPRQSIMIGSRKQQIRISQLWMYPLKSASPIAVSTAVLDKWGLKYDRIFMLVEEDKKEDGKFKSMSQKRYPVVSSSSHLS